MKVMLINPPRIVRKTADFPPPGLMYIGAVLKKDGHQIRILDAANNYTWERMEDEIRKFGADVVGITCWTIEREQAFKLANMTRKILPDAKIVLGGQHATAFPQHMFQVASADFVVLGEGELTMSELVAVLESNGNVSNILGIAYLRDGAVIRTDPRPLIEDLDMLPLPLYDDIDLTKYKGLPEVDAVAAAIMTSRGCPFNCIFCSSKTFWGNRRWRARSPQNVVDEIQWLYNKHNVRALIIFDDLFTLKKNRAIEICKEIITRKIDIMWVAEARIDTVDAELLYWMKKAGCYRIDYGVESGSPKIFKNIGKHSTPEMIKRAFRLTREAGINPNAYLMVGNIGETEETIDETIALMKEINPNQRGSGAILYVLPNTQLYDIAKQRKLITDDYWLEGDERFYYTGEHSLEELHRLCARLEYGLAINNKSLYSYLGYIYHECSRRMPFFERFFSGVKQVVKRFLRCCGIKRHPNLGSLPNKAIKSP